MKSFKTILVSLFAIVTIAGCSNSGGSDSTTATTATTSATGYTVSNGTCYNSSNQAVDSNYCANISNYYQVNSYCFNTSGERVDDSYCRTSGLTLPPRQCNGRFFAPRQGKRQEIRCQDRNCHGNLVFDEKGQPVHCR